MQCRARLVQGCGVGAREAHGLATPIASRQPAAEPRADTVAKKFADPVDPKGGRRSGTAGQAIQRILGRFQGFFPPRLAHEHAASSRSRSQDCPRLHIEYACIASR